MHASISVLTFVSKKTKNWNQVSNKSAAIFYSFFLQVTFHNVLQVYALCIIRVELTLRN